MGPNFSFDFEVFLQSVIELRICVKKGKFKKKGKRSGLNHEKSILIYHLGQLYTEVEFVNAVTASGSVKFLPAV